MWCLRTLVHVMLGCAYEQKEHGLTTRGKGFPYGKIIIIMLLSPSLPPPPLLTSQHFGQDFNTEKKLCVSVSVQLIELFNHKNV